MPANDMFGDYVLSVYIPSKLRVGPVVEVAPLCPLSMTFLVFSSPLGLVVVVALAVGLSDFSLNVSFLLL